MQACRYALEVVAKHPIYLLVYVGFLSLMGLFITSGVYPPATSAGYESAEVPFAVIDRDQSDLSRSVAAFLEERGTSVEVADEARACQDAVATGLVDYLLIVPAGFEEGYLAAARDGGDGPRLETVFSFQSMAATLVDTQVNQYLGLVRAAAVLEPDSSPEVLVAQAEASAQKEPRIEEVSVPGVAVGSEAFVFYLMWSAYPLTVAVVVSVGILMGAFNRTDVRRRVARLLHLGLGSGAAEGGGGARRGASRVGRYHGHRPCRIRLFRIHPRTGRSCLRAGGGARVRAHPAGHRVSAGAAGLRRECVEHRGQHHRHGADVSRRYVDQPGSYARGGARRGHLHAGVLARRGPARGGGRCDGVGGGRRRACGRRALAVRGGHLRYGARGGPDARDQRRRRAAMPRPLCRGSAVGAVPGSRRTLRRGRCAARYVGCAIVSAPCFPFAPAGNLWHNTDSRI